MANPDQHPRLAKELIALHPEAIFAQSTPAAAMLQRETQIIPVVFVNVSDPIGSGFVSSLARPGANLTGVIAYEPGYRRQVAGDAQRDWAAPDARGLGG